MVMTLRQRRRGGESPQQQPQDDGIHGSQAPPPSASGARAGSPHHEASAAATKAGEAKAEEGEQLPPPNTYWLTRVLFLRSLGFLYAVAFLVSLDQNQALLGDRGLLPAVPYMDFLARRVGGADKWYRAPTLFWLLHPFHQGNGPFDTTIPFDQALRACSLAGLCLAAYVTVAGAANWFILLVLWALYMSIINVGQTWYSFGWESQLLETGFLAIFLVPIFRFTDRFPQGLPSPQLCVWGYRWLLFRIMIGAGMIKIRGDPCWRDLTCMDYHYETQPNPNPLSWYFHHAPSWWHRVETMGNHVVELALPWLLLLPHRGLRTLGGLAQIAFQAVLISSGNLSFLNWLTMIPAIWALDDRFLASFTPFPPPPSPSSVAAAASESSKAKTSSSSLKKGKNNGSSSSSSSSDSTTPSPSLSTSKRTSSSSSSESPLWLLPLRWLLTFSPAAVATTVARDKAQRAAGYNKHPYRIFRLALHGAVACLIAYLSVPVVRNLLSPRQAMNTSFEPLRIVNTYGAFGSITKERTEVIFKGTNASHPEDPTAVWREYEFKCKPGAVSRRPCLISPYHYRLDWLMWFAAFSRYNEHHWVIHLAIKLLQGDPLARGLIAHDPFQGEDSLPTFIKGDHYRYRFAGRGGGGGDKAASAVWERRFIGEYFPPVSLDNPSIRDYAAHFGWPTDWFPSSQQQQQQEEQQQH